MISIKTIYYITNIGIQSEKGHHTGVTNPWAFLKMQMAATNEKLQMRMRKPLTVN